MLKASTQTRLRSQTLSSKKKANRHIPPENREVKCCSCGKTFWRDDTASLERWQHFEETQSTRLVWRFEYCHECFPDIA